MRAARATLAVAITILLVGASSAGAAPTDVRVRIEGATSTLFDRMVRTDGHTVRASSDSVARRCDGTNAGRAPSPGPTATTAAVDALALLGQGFDGQWSPGFDDYYVAQLGPEREDNDAAQWWGVLVNRHFSPLGGCQRQVQAGDEVLWTYDAFSNRPFLWLDGPATAPLGVPVSVGVTATASSTSNDQTAGPPYAGAVVGAVGANGQPAPAGTADTGTSAANGTALVVFHAAGWQRLKGRAPDVYPAAIASNSVDVCVEANPGDGCAGLPPSQQPQIATQSESPMPPTGDSGGEDRRHKAPKAAVPRWTRGLARGTLRDDRARGLRWRGSWLRTVTANAWKGTLTRGAASASVALKLGAGRPAFALLTAGDAARVEIRVGGRVRALTLPASRSPRIRLLIGPRLDRRGTAVLRVLSGTIYVDGVGRAG